MTESVVLDLNENGDLLDPRDDSPVRSEAVPDLLARRVIVPEDATDVVVFTHGWRNSRDSAQRQARQFFTLVEEHYLAQRDDYPRVDAWNAYYVIVRWPSMSNPFPQGYRRIRDRAHAMTTRGHAGQVLGHLLGYLNSGRRLPGSPPALGSYTGQYLHCVGHSFGGRFLVEAVQAAADRKPPALAWNRENPDYPYTVDTLLIFQMAAHPDIFAGPLVRILSNAPINGPVVLTHSRADRATGLWHRLAEGAPGIGQVGARSPVDHIIETRLHPVSERYRYAELDSRIVNVDSGWRFRRGRWRSPAGAHSDIWYPESAHLVLSLANLAR